MIGRWLIAAALLKCFVLGDVLAQEKAIGFQMDPDKERVTIPFDLINNLMVIEVTLNDQLPLKFVFDSGVRTPILTDKYMTDIIRVSYDREVELFSAGAQGVAMAYVADDVNISIPGIYAEDQDIFVLKEDFLGLSAIMGETVHGLIGYDFFKEFVVRVDYKKEEITFIRPSDFHVPNFSESLPLLIEDAKAYVMAEVLLPDGTVRPSKLLLDTGASHALWLDPPEDSLQNILPPVTVESAVGKALSGEIMGYLGRVSTLNIDNHRFKSVLTSFPRRSDYISIIRNTGRQGSIGSEVLRRFDITFDYNNSRIYLRRNSDYRDPFQYNMSGLSVIRDLSTSIPTFIIESVEENSPAGKAGLQIGDQIVRFNGAGQESLSLNMINYVLKLKEGKRVRMTILRDGVRLKKEFRLKSLI